MSSSNLFSVLFVPFGFIGAKILGEGGTGMANWTPEQWGAFVALVVIPVILAIRGDRRMNRIEKDQHAIAQVASPNVEAKPEAEKRVDEIAKNGA